MQNSAEAGMQPILLDVREEDEYAVSHIAGAVRVDVGDTGKQRTQPSHTDTQAWP